MEWCKGGGVDSEKEGEDAEGGMPVYHSNGILQTMDGGHIVSN